MTPMARAGSVLSLALLAACGPGMVITSHVDTYGAYDPAYFAYGAGGRDLRVVIRGNPTSAPQDEFEQAVTAAMQGRNWGPTTNFTTRPSASARTDYWVGMVFGGDSFVGGRAICRGGDGVDLDPTQRPVRLQAAFCFQTKPLTELQVTVDDVASVDDPRLEQMVGAAVIELFPPFDETRDDDDGCRRRAGKC